jgi:hypothetical protein
MKYLMLGMITEAGQQLPATFSSGTRGSSIFGAPGSRGRWRTYWPAAPIRS